MFDDEQLLVKMVDSCIVRGWMERQSSWHYTRPPRCEIIRDINAEYSSGVDQCSANVDGLTEDEVAALLKCPLSAVSGLLRQGWLKHIETTVLFQSLLPGVLDRPSTEQFAKRYILLHELCEAFDLPGYLLVKLMDAARVKTNGFSSGPEFFPRASTLALISQLQNYTSLSADDVQRSPAQIMPDMLKDIRCVLMQINVFQKNQAERIPDQKPKYFCFDKKSSGSR
jgi:hypothetical protein